MSMSATSGLFQGQAQYYKILLHGQVKFTFLPVLQDASTFQQLMSLAAIREDPRGSLKLKYPCLNARSLDSVHWLSE